MSNLKPCPVCGRTDLTHDAHTFRCHEIEELWKERDALRRKLDIALEEMKWLINNCFDENDIRMIKNSLKKLVDYPPQDGGK